MVYTYTPTYYSTLHDSITSICKNILPFPFKKKKLPAIAAAEQKLSEQQSDHLKWQQESFHQILKLIGLCKEGIVPETQVSAFRVHLLETLVASPFDYEQPAILKDKMIFLQELLYAKCITDDEYHSSKRPLLQRLAVQGVEIESKNVIVKGAKRDSSNEEEWSEIDLNNDKCLPSSKGSSNSNNMSLPVSSSASSKKIKGAASSVLGFIAPRKASNVGEEIGGNEIFSKNGETENETKSILMSESLPSKIGKVELQQTGGSRAKKNPFRTLFHREQRGEERGDNDNHRLDHSSQEKAAVSGKKQHLLFKKWKNNDCNEDETAPLPLRGERSDDDENYLGRLVETPIGEGSETKDFLVDKVLAGKIKKALSGIQAETGANQNIELTDEQIEAISTRLPVETNVHVEEMGNSQRQTKERQGSNDWATFDEDNENLHPNLFVRKDNNVVGGRTLTTTNISIDKGLKYNPFFEI